MCVYVCVVFGDQDLVVKFPRKDYLLGTLEYSDCCCGPMVFPSCEAIRCYTEQELLEGGEAGVQRWKGPGSALLCGWVQGSSAAV